MSARKPVAKKSVARKAPAKAPTKASAPRTSKTKVATAIPSITNRYDAAGMGRRMSSWNPPNHGPNKSITGIENIRKRSSDTVRNDWAGAAGVQHWTTNLVGTGIFPRVPRSVARAKKLALKKLWKKWCKTADADGVLDFYGMQTLATRAWLERGEVFIRMRPRRADSGMEVPFQIQLLEADMVPMLDADNWPGLPAGNKIRSGIELNSRSQRVAYWVYKQHPGDGESFDSSSFIRVAKSQMLHVFEPKRPNQLRGVPDFAAVIAHLRNVMDFSDTVLERQKIANLFTAFLTKQMSAFPQDDVDPLTGQPYQKNDDGTGNISLQNGALVELNQGEGVVFSNPPEAGTTYSDYIRTQHLGTAAGQGLPYEILTGDIKEVSDRTLRVIMNEFRRFAEQRQWQVIIPMMCQPVREYWVDVAVLAGKIAVADIELAKEVEWSPDGWPYIHPVQDVQAKESEVNAGFRSRDSVIAEGGDDPDEVDEERAESQKREKALGIESEADKAAKLKQQQAGQGGKSKTEGDGIAPGEYPRNAYFDRLRAERLQAETDALNAKALEATRGGPSDTARLLEAFTNMMTQQQAQMQATMQAFSVVLQSFAAQPRVTNVAAPVVENHIPAPVVENHIPAPIVQNNVNPTPVSVTNEVTVQPAEVKVELPDRKITSDIERDETGNIVKVEQTETTITPTTH